jgi:hypothetical protein
MSGLKFELQLAASNGEVVNTAKKFNLMHKQSPQMFY